MKLHLDMPQKDKKLKKQNSGRNTGMLFFFHENKNLFNHFSVRLTSHIIIAWPVVVQTPLGTEKSEWAISELLFVSVLQTTGTPS